MRRGPRLGDAPDLSRSAAFVSLRRMEILDFRDGTLGRAALVLRRRRAVAG
jgi:hypothetical protein